MIRAQVARFWIILTSKRSESLKEFYDPQAIVFSSSATRSEVGSLTVVRRNREYISSAAEIHYALGDIDVQAIGREVVVASYAFSFDARNVAGPHGLKDEKITQGRATQVFVAADDGTLRIVHEHFSIAADSG